jgi:hypothetical protein
METTFLDPQPQEGKGRASSTILIVAVAAIVLIAGALWFFLSTSPSQKVPAGAANANVKMSPAEEQYLKKVQVGDVALSRAENFLRQEVTIINGEVFNAGSESVSALRLTMEFNDDMNQVVLRETRPALGTPDVALAPGEHRAFEISFEHVPASWNMQQPAIRPTYLRLPAHK